MIGIMGLMEVANELRESGVGKYSDSYNYVLFLKKMSDGSLKSFQMCVEEDEIGKDMYISEFDLFTEEIGGTWELKYFEGYCENEEVYVISEIVKNF